MAGEYGWGGLGGGLGGPGFPDILTALGTALLSSPRDAPFANLPQTLQTATQAGQQRQSNAAMALALTKAGVDPETAATLSMNPTAASLMVAQGNLQRQLDQSSAYDKRVSASRGAGNMGLGPPPVSAPGAPAGAPASPVSAAPGMNPFTSLVMRTEGTDPSTAPQASGFNTTLGYGKFAGGQTNLTGMTVNQVLDLQQRMLSHPENNLNSSAAGGFQVVGKTLRSLRDAGVVGGDDLYNEDTQTKIANHLAQNVRGRDVGALRQEWPSLKGVPDDQVLSAYDAAYGSGREAAAPDSAPATGQPVRVAAAGSKIPVPIPAGAGYTPPYTPPAGGSPTTNRTQAWAQAEVDFRLSELQRAKALGNEGLVARITAELPQYTKWLEPTELQRSFANAGMDINGPEAQAVTRSNITRPERTFQAEQAHRQDTLDLERKRLEESQLTDEQKRVRAMQGQYGPAIELQRREEDARKAREREAETQATARGAFAKEATAGAQVAQNLQRAVGRANIHLNNVIEMGGYGWLESNPVARTLAHATPDIPRVTNWHATEVERQHFDNAMATVGAAVAAAKNKAEGGGNMSAIEQTLARQDLAILTSADPSVAKGAMKQLQSQIDDALELDREHGLYGGKQVLRGASRLNRAVSGSMGNIVQTPHGTLREIP